MGTTPYDITRYQPVLFAGTSLAQLLDELGSFFASYDDEAYARLVADQRSHEQQTHERQTHERGASHGSRDDRPERRPAPAAGLLRGWDHVELWVGNALASAQFFCSAFGFTISAYAGPETGAMDRASYVLDQGAVRLVVTAGLSARSAITAHVQRHGDGVRDLAWQVDDVDEAVAGAVARGARTVSEAAESADDEGVVRKATVAAYGETVHTFVDRSRYGGTFAPHYRSEGLPPSPPGASVGVQRIDHVVGNVELGSLGRWVDFYESVLGFSGTAALRRRADPDRVLGAHVDGGVERREHPVAPQRTGRGAAQEPDPGVPRHL